MERGLNSQCDPRHSGTQDYFAECLARPDRTMRIRRLLEWQLAVDDGTDLFLLIDAATARSIPP